MDAITLLDQSYSYRRMGRSVQVDRLDQHYAAHVDDRVSIELPTSCNRDSPSSVDHLKLTSFNFA
jgi:hypothetical protein